jgi:hypothetical protein
MDLTIFECLACHAGKTGFVAVFIDLVALAAVVGAEGLTMYAIGLDYAQVWVLN